MRLLLLPILLLGACAGAPEVPTVEPAELGGTTHLTHAGSVYLAGQPDAAGLTAARDAGVTVVIDLRGADEDRGLDEAAAVAAAGMRYVALPVTSPADLDDALFDTVRRELREADGVLLHCRSANRVGAAWLPFRVLDQGVPVEVALEEARAVGLRTPALQQAALDYLERQGATPVR